MEGNFSNRVQTVIQLAREEAIRLGHDYIGTEHLLLGIIREGEGIAVKILKRYETRNEDLLFKIKKAIEDVIRSSGSTLTIGNIPMSKQAEKVLRITYLEAKLYKSDVIGTEHLLLSLLRDEDNIAAQILNQFGINYDGVRNTLDRIIAGETTKEAKLNDCEMKDIKILNFIYHRMEDMYKENKNIDYMITFKKFIDKYEKSLQPNDFKPKNTEEVTKRAIRSDDIVALNKFFKDGYDIIEMWGDLIIVDRVKK